MKIHTVGIIGNGHFGAFVRDVLRTHAPEFEVRTYSQRADPDGRDFFALHDVAQCDVVVPCVPISAFEDTLARLAPLMLSGSILLDVATVKKYTTEVIHRIMPQQPYLATHPMFGPESYKKKGNTLSGLRIVVTGTNLSEAALRAFKVWFVRQGLSVVELTSDEHDRHLAKTLFLTHLVGQTIHRAGFDRTVIDTVSFGFLMDAVESVQYDTALFADVATYNPYCTDVIERFSRALEEVKEIAASPQPIAGFK
jgi:prephenate dehydrogenase